MTYDWSKKDILQDIKTLESLLKKETDIEKKYMIFKAISYIKEIYDIVDELDDEIDDIEYSKEVIYWCFKEFYNELAPYYVYLKDFNTKTKNIKIDKYNNLSELKIDKTFTKDDLLESLNNYYKTFDQEIYNAFLKLYENRYKSFSFTNEKKSIMGVTNYIPYLNKIYIKQTFNEQYPLFEDVITAAHETGHAISAFISNERYSNSKKTFREIESTFFELLAINYYADLFKNKEYNSYHLEILDNNIYNAKKIIRAEKSILKYTKLSDIGIPIEKISRKTQIKYYENDPKGYLNQVKYTVSYIVALNLYEIYQKDKEKSLYLLKNILTNTSNDEYITMIKNVYPSSQVEEYYKHVRKLMK